MRSEVEGRSARRRPWSFGRHHRTAGGVPGAVPRAHLDVAAREGLLRPGGVLLGQLRLDLELTGHVGDELLGVVAELVERGRRDLWVAEEPNPHLLELLVAEL